MIKSLLIQNEEKTLEFKENVRPMQSILRTAVAFANTAGGTLVFGVRDRTKEIVGVKNALDFFDEQPCTETNSEAIDFRAASEFFARVARKITPSARWSLGLLVKHAGSGRNNWLNTYLNTRKYPLPMLRAFGMYPIERHEPDYGNLRQRDFWLRSERLPRIRGESMS